MMTQPRSTSLHSADEWIQKLSLIPHPEGGYYREIFRSPGAIDGRALPVQYGGTERAYVTSIYFLLKSGECSRYHRLHSDELWYFHAGSPLTISMIDSRTGVLTIQKLGFDSAKQEVLQFAVPAESWFGAEVDEPDSFTLISCVVAPGFDFADFELGRRTVLLREFPQHRESIERFTSD